MASFVAEHMATFVIKNGTHFTIEESVKKLLQLESMNGLWPLKVTAQLVPHHFDILDAITGNRVERFSLKSLKNVQSINAGGSFNNLIVFTVADESAPEFHIFRCLGRNAADLVTSIEQAKNEKSPADQMTHLVPNPAPAIRSVLDKLNTADISKVKDLLRRSVRYPSLPRLRNPSQILDPSERKVKLLDCLFSDIETFVIQLQKAVEAYNNLKKKNAISENGSEDGLLSRIPPGKDFKDVLQKFKMSFILIEDLKQKISNPNAPELIHFLFKPLGFVVRVISGPNLEKLELVSSVDNPLINEQVRSLFENCLSTAENVFWKKLGRAWTSTSDEWHEELPTYRPVFQDGWCPPLDWMRDIFQAHVFVPSVQSKVGDSSSNTKVHPRLEMKSEFSSQDEFLKHLQSKNAKHAIVKEAREAANPRELTVKAGEFLEILNDSKNWWKMKNIENETGFVPKKNLHLPS